MTVDARVASSEPQRVAAYRVYNRDESVNRVLDDLLAAML